MKLFSNMVLTMLAIVASQQSFASEVAPAIDGSVVRLMTQVTPFDMINWKVGDSAAYTISLGSMPNIGTMTKAVTKEENGAIWIHQEANLVIQQDTTDMLMSRADGKILKVIHNGKEEAAPDDKPEIISQDTTEVTVPAGTFKAIHVVGKTKDIKKFEVWANPRDTVMDGSIKMVMSAQMEVTMELQSFKRIP